MSYTPANSTRDLWALIGILVTVFATLTARRKPDAESETSATESESTLEPRS